MTVPMKKLKRTKIGWGALGLLFLLLLAGTDNLSAQRRMRGRPFANPNPARRAERFDMLMKLKLVEALDLSPEQGDKFLPVFNQYRQKTQRLLRARGEIMQDLIRHVRSRMGNLEPGENPEEFSERELKERLVQLDELRRQQEANRDEFYHKTGQVLSTEQLTRLIVFEEMFARDIVRNLPNP